MLPNIQIPQDLQACINFHGHLCPGLVIGYSAAKAGMEIIGAQRSEDEELIAIVENNACGVDAIQMLTGCTFGKGNFFFRDYGKMAFTLALRPTGKSVRLCFRHVTPPDIEELPEDQRRNRRIEFMLEQHPHALFTITEATIQLPEPATIHKSRKCDNCDEMTMETRTRQIGGRTLCIPCAEASHQ